MALPSTSTRTRPFFTNFEKIIKSGSPGLGLTTLKLTPTHMKSVFDGRVRVNRKYLI